MESNNYNSIAPFYDRLARLVFGNTLLDAQSCFLAALPDKGNLLIAGGGSGAVLSRLSGFSGTVYFVDKSEKMIALAQKNAPRELKIHFHAQDIFTFLEECSVTFDIILSSFFFDNFRQQQAVDIASRLYYRLAHNGFWQNTDFKYTAENAYYLPNRLLIKAMYLFFKMTAHIGTGRLPDLSSHFRNAGKFRVIQSETFYMDSIAACLYRKK